MARSFFKWALKVFPDSSSFYSYYGNYSDVGFLKNWFDSTNKRLKNTNFDDNDFIEIPGFECYDGYFNLLKSMGLQREFELMSSEDKIFIRGTFIESFFVNSKNRKKLIIFCHGISNNRWSSFYSIYLALQSGYSVVTYDARNHGFSDKSYTTLGQVESNDLEDIVNWSLENLDVTSIGIHGFSMGASTVIHWLGKFQNKHHEVKGVFCEAPFDDFAQRFEYFLSNQKNFSNKENALSIVTDGENKNKSSYFSRMKNHFFYTLAMKILKTPFSLYDVKPINFLPKVLGPNLLIIHGSEDSVINCKSSIEIWKKILENEINKEKVKLFLVEGADHDDIFFHGEFKKKKIFQYNSENFSKNSDLKKNSDFTFSSIFFSFFGESL